MIKLAIFDLDGTLVNSIEDLADATNRALAENGYPVQPIENFNHYVGNGTKKLIERALPVGTDMPEQERIHSVFSEYYRGGCLNKTKPYEGIVSALRELRRQGVICTVASNKPDAFSKSIVSALFDDVDFDLVRGKTDGMKAKPEPDIVFAILEELGISADQAVMIGDSDVDVITAHNAGVKCIGCEWGFRGHEELERAGAEFIVSEPGQILEVCRSIT